MSCRTNLKKEKRQRNRINAFRFKKGGFSKRRFNNGPDYAAQQKAADEDSKFYSLVRCSSPVLATHASSVALHARMRAAPRLTASPLLLWVADLLVFGGGGRRCRCCRGEGARREGGGVKAHTTQVGLAASPHGTLAIVCHRAIRVHR